MLRARIDTLDDMRCGASMICCADEYKASSDLEATYFADVLSRVENYVLTRIPEAIEVQIEDPAQLDDTMVEGGYEISPEDGNAGKASR